MCEFAFANRPGPSDHQPNHQLSFDIVPRELYRHKTWPTSVQNMCYRLAARAVVVVESQRQRKSKRTREATVDILLATWEHASSGMPCD